MHHSFYFLVCMDKCKERKNNSKEMCKDFCKIFVKCMEKGAYNKKNAKECENEASKKINMKMRNEEAATISSKATTITTNTVQYSNGMLSASASCIPLTILINNLFMYY